MNPETIIQNEVIVKMNELGCITMRRNVGLFYTKNMMPIKIGTPGEPDLEILCPGGITLFFEMKTLTGKAREDQKKFHKVLRELGHHVFTVRSVQQAVDIFNEHVGTSK